MSEPSWHRSTVAEGWQVALGVGVAVKEINQEISSGMKNSLRWTVKNMGKGVGKIVEV